MPVSSYLAFPSLPRVGKSYVQKLCRKRQSLLYFAIPPFPTKVTTFVGPITKGTRRYISVALSLGSPPAAVSRYPARRSPDFPQMLSFEIAPAAAQLSHFISFYILFVILSILCFEKEVHSFQTKASAINQHNMYEDSQNA